MVPLRSGRGGSWPPPAPHSLIVLRPAKLGYMTAPGDMRTVTGAQTPPDRPGRGSGAGPARHRASLLELAPLPGAIPCARLHAVHVLHEWGLRDLAVDAALIVSE